MNGLPANRPPRRPAISGINGRRGAAPYTPRVVGAAQLIGMVAMLGVTADAGPAILAEDDPAAYVCSCGYVSPLDAGQKCVQSAAATRTSSTRRW